MAAHDRTVYPFVSDEREAREAHADLHSSQHVMPASRWLAVREQVNERPEAPPCAMVRCAPCARAAPRTSHL
jgi:hypothetical protein